MLLEQPKKEYLRCNFWLPLFLKHNYNVVIGADLQRANSVQGTAVFLQRRPFVSINKGVVPRILFLCFKIRPADWDSLYCLTHVPCQPQAYIEGRGRWTSPAPPEQHPSDNLKMQPSSLRKQWDPLLMRVHSGDVLRRKAVLIPHRRVVMMSVGQQIQRVRQAQALE